jgi:hypothetical protein
MPNYKETDTLGKILKEHPQAVDLLNSAARLQTERFENQELFVAAPYLGMTIKKMHEFLGAVNKMR